MLTEREKEILELMNAGTSRKDIARKLSISVHTVKAFEAIIKKKLAVANKIVM